MNIIFFYKIGIFLPLVSALITGFFGRTFGNRPTHLFASGAMVISALISLLAFYNVALHGQSGVISLLTWMQSGTMQFEWALRFDTLSAVMMVVVCVVSACVHIYSAGYMHEDESQPRFMSYLSLFTFMMLMLITANNLVQMFFGWEGVGLASYLLIGFWYEKPAANAAAMKAFLVNRVGDFGFALGIFGIYALFGTVNFEGIFSQVEQHGATSMAFLGYEFHAISLLCVLLFIGAMGKSAQLGLHTWLPDAMEGPTPVSALIHAATMVTAGVFMVARLSPLFEYAPSVLEFVAFIGATTAFFAASVGLTQNDIKRVIAYSTCSQLGYMFFAIGMSAYPAAIFHLFTHAFFKALLFLGAGSVIHALHHEQDMRRMGGIWKKIPVTYALMWIGNLALAGIPLFAGFYSKDMILESAYAAHETGNRMAFYAYGLGTLVAGMTAFYSWRLLFMTFHGKSKLSASDLSHVHEAPFSMMIPLILLAIGAVFSGALFYDYFVGHDAHAFWQQSIFILPQHNAMELAHHVPALVKYLPLGMSVAGIGLAYMMYIRQPKLPARVARAVPRLYKISFNKWYVDELYDRIFVQPLLRAGRILWQSVDAGIIDRFGPNGAAFLAQTFARRLSALQSGYLYHYAFVMLVGVTALLSYLIWKGGV